MQKQGILLKIDKNKMIVLTDEGEFLERPLPKKLPSLGAKVIIPAERPAFALRKLSWVAVLLIFVLSFSILRPILISPAVAAVAFDLPVGVELGVDEKNRVVKVVTKDKRAEALYANLNLKGQDVYIAANQLIEATLRPENASVIQDEGAFLVTVMPLKSRGKMMLDHRILNENMRAVLSEQAFDGYFILQDSNEDLREKAAELDLPIAKYLLWQRGIDSEDEFLSIEELKALSMTALVSQGEEMLEKRFPGMWHHMGHQNGMIGPGPQMGHQGQGMGPGHLMNGSGSTDAPSVGAKAQMDETKKPVLPQQGKPYQRKGKGMMR